MVPRRSTSSRKTNTNSWSSDVLFTPGTPYSLVPLQMGCQQTLVKEVYIYSIPPKLFNIEMSRLPGENTPLGESVWMIVIPEGYPQGANDIRYLVPNWQYMIPTELDQDESNAAPHSEILLPSSIVSQSPPPEPTHTADIVVDAQSIDASLGVGSPSEARPRCDHCGRTFGRRQELVRHLDQVGKPRKICPFKLCTYNWIRPDKIKAHIIKIHGSQLCPKVLKQIPELRGKRFIEFLDAYYDIGMGDTYPLHLPPLLEPSGGVSEEYYLSDFCECPLESIGVASSEGLVEPMVEG